MQAIATNTQGVRSGAEEITQASDDLSRRTEQQAASLEETSRDAGEGCGPRAAAHIRRLSPGRLSPGRATAVEGIGGVRFSSHSRSGGRESGNVSRDSDGAHAPFGFSWAERFLDISRICNPRL
jgi:hypothetical protein